MLTLPLLFRAQNEKKNERYRIANEMNCQLAARYFVLDLSPRAPRNRDTLRRQP